MPTNKTNGRTSLAPAPLGNQRARTHGLYAQLRPLESAEVDELAATLRELSPLDTDALEPLVQLVAGQLWRRKLGYQDLQSHGVVRGRADRGKVAPIWQALDQLERQILAGLVALSLTPQAAASLDLTLVRARNSDRFDMTALSAADRATLERLLEKARTHE